MNKYRSAVLALAAATASLTVAACSAGTPTATSTASSPAASSSAPAGQGITSSAPPTAGAPIPGRMLDIKGTLGTFPVPAAAKVGENMSGGQSVIVVFGLVAPADVARFYATALPQAGYTVTSNALVSKGGQNGALIVFSGHGYKGNIEAVNQVVGPNIGGLGGQNVTTILMAPSK
ncbi:MAG TPA: hypothetical protein VK284_14305 [Streptosporangiaceae bacterium]|nr:hypothetical protein [Streptosporangiaceae bacterium]